MNDHDFGFSDKLRASASVKEFHQTRGTHSSAISATYPVFSSVGHYAAEEAVVALLDSAVDLGPEKLYNLLAC